MLRKKEKKKKGDEAYVLYVCVWIDGWDGWISMTYEAKEKSAQ